MLIVRCNAVLRGLAGAGEWEALASILPDFEGKAALDYWMWIWLALSILC